MHMPAIFPGQLSVARSAG